MLKASTPISNIVGIGPRFLSKFKRLGINTVYDLLLHFPFRYEDFSTIYKIGEVEPGQQATVRGVIRSVDIRRSFRRGMLVVEAVIEDNSGDIRAVWFNQPYIKNVLRPGKIANFSGKVSVSNGDVYLNSPAYEIVGFSKETKHTGRLVPIYPETKGLTSKGIRFIMQPILKNIEPFKEWIPEEILEKNGLPNINDAFNFIHFPRSMKDVYSARKRFAFEDLFLLQIYNLQQKLRLSKKKSYKIKTDIENLKKILNGLPFELTLPQKKSLWEIIKDIRNSAPMNRLLQGDVGSGKTVVAALAAIIVSQNGYQTAFMAPTEVLANQHFNTIKNLFGSIDCTGQPVIGLITSSSAKIFYERDVEANVKKEEFMRVLKSGNIKIVIGTHSLIQKSLEFKNLAFVIVDEQHRFGVEQRQVLISRSQNKNLIPHFLSMSATPIPRTLMLTIFGDLDVSTITELPSGRKKIITKIISPSDIDKTYKFIRKEIKSGRQAFVVCPRIEPGQDVSGESNVLGLNKLGPVYKKEAASLEVKSVKEEYEKLSKNIFPDLRVGILHGQMKPKEKDKIMKAFKKGDIDILVSTSVIEVGVDVPNATIMMIEGADRFGLAQLYQFRGRVGRGEHQSYCFLFSESSSRTTSARLKALIEAKNGFELAEKDLKIRGPGEFLGQKQTGIPDIAMAGLQNPELIKASRDSALKVIKSDYTLKKYPELNAKIEEFQREIHRE